jgi:hypothetical protein
MIVPQPQQIRDPLGIDTRIRGLLSQNNPLFENARVEGARFANRRGLLNSSIAGQAAQQAVLGVALPIASQEAQQENQRVIQLRDQAFSGDQSERERQQAQLLQRNQLASSDRQFFARLQEERAANLRGLEGERQRGAAALAASAEQNFASIFSNIANNERIPAQAREQLLAQASRQRESTLRLVRQIYGIQLQW